MSIKSLAVRLFAEGGRQVRAEFEGVGNTGERSMRQLETSAEAANRRLERFGRRVRVAFAAAAVAAATAAAAMIRSGLQVLDTQAKLAQSLDTTVESVQVLDRAADLSGISIGMLNGALERMTRRLSQAAAGGGPAAGALERLGLNARELLALPIDERILLIRQRMDEFVPAAERAAVMADIFGRRAGLIMDRVSTQALEQATQDVRDFGVAVSELDAQSIQRTNDAISRLGLIWRGVANQLAVAAAPALEAVADAMAAIARQSGPLGRAIRAVFDNLGRLASTATAFVAFVAGRWVAAMALAAARTLWLARSLTVLRAAMIRTGLLAMVVAAGELIYWLGRLVTATGGFGEALSALGEVARAVWDGIVLSAQSIPLRLRAVWLDMQAGFTQALANMARKFSEWTSGFEVFAGLAPVGPLAPLAALGTLAQGSASAVGSLTSAAADFTLRAEQARHGAEALAGAGFAKVSEAVQNLRDLLTETGDDTVELNGQITDSLANVEDALNRTGGAGRAAGAALEEAAEAAAEGWARVATELERYRDEAMDLYGQLGSGIVGAFRSAESALGEFVRTGKLQVGDLVRSIIADFAQIAARRFIFGPLSNALMGALGGVGAPLNAMGSGPLASFAGGGHTGWGARSGGLDGMGGRLAMIHPQERIIDESGGRGRREAVPVTVNIMTRDAESFRQSRSQVASDIARAVARGRRGL